MKKGYWYILATTILFSSMEISLKMIADQYNPVQITFLRFVIGAIILLPLALRHLRAKKIRLDKKDWKVFAWTGFICIVVSMMFYQVSLGYSKASIVAVVFSCNPVFVVPLAHWILKEEIDKLTILSLVISVVGLVFILNPFNLGGNSILGILCAILSAVTFALYAVVGKSEGHKIGPIVLTCFSFIMGVIECFVLIIVSHIGGIAAALTNVGLEMFANVPVFAGITLANLPYLLYVGIGVTGLGYAFYFLAMEETSAATTSVVFFIKPALAPVLAMLILGESIALSTFGGIAFIVVGSGITLLAHRKKAKHVIDEAGG